MSIDHLNKAFKSNIKPSARKFVLVALSDYANEDGEAYPSIETISRKTSLNIKTVKVHLKALVEMRILRHTGRMVGKTHQIPVYSIHFETSPISPNEPVFSAKESKNGSVKQAQNRATEPPIHFNHQIDLKDSARDDDFKIPDWANKSAWDEFEQHRRDIKKPLTDLARKKNLSVLDGLSADQQQESIDATIANRWTGLFKPKNTGNGYANKNQQSEMLEMEMNSLNF